MTAPFSSSSVPTSGPPAYPFSFDFINGSPFLNPNNPRILSYLIWICLIYYTIITLVLALVSTIKPFRSFLHHGKVLIAHSLTAPMSPRPLRHATDLRHSPDLLVSPDTSNSWLAVLLSFRVPKVWFAHFYLVAVSMSVLLSLTFGLSKPIFLFALHACRRYQEQLRFFKQSHSPMHIAHYLLGLSFYTVTPISISLSVTLLQLKDVYHSPGWFLTSLFLACNVAQLTHHYFLSILPKPSPVFSKPQHRSKPSLRTASHNPKSSTSVTVNSSPPRVNQPIPPMTPNRPLRRTSHQDSGPPLVYKLPQRGLFIKVTCPHYFFEILIYACFCLMLWPSYLMIACLTWVFVNLTVSATQSHEYYRQAHGKTRKYRIFPGVY